MENHENQENINTLDSSETPESPVANVSESEAATIEAITEEAPTHDVPTSDTAKSTKVEPSVSPIEELHALAAAEAEQWDYMPKAVGRLKRREHPFLRAFFILLVIFVILFVTMAQAVFGKGWLKNRINPQDDTKINFTLPIAQTPELDDYYYQADGRYTVQGIAKAILPSIVTIEIFVTGYPLTPYSQGSGIIMSSDGYIITNAHVIKDASLAILVRLSDGTEYDATVVGGDTKSDLAVIKIDAEDLQAAQFGDSDALELGEEVVALGTPAGMEGSVTAGIVSGLDRQIKVNSDNIEMSCIQITAAINPGNSGGALVNMWGQVVGVVSSKMASEEYDNIGFAIEMSAAKPIIEQLIENGCVLGRPKIGISFYEVSDAYGEYYDMPGGLYVAAVEEDCDIANTDLQIDDIITSMNGIEVRSANDVYAIILELNPGDTMTAHVLRPLDDDYTEFDEFDIEFKLMSDDSAFIIADE